MNTTTDPTPTQTTSHISAVRDLPADENGRGNLAGWKAECPDCGWTAGSTIHDALLRDVYDHWAYMNDRRAYMNFKSSR